MNLTGNLTERLVEIDVDGLSDEKGVRFIGNATRQPDGTWRCLADVNGCLCIVEVTITTRVVEQRP